MTRPKSIVNLQDNGINLDTLNMGLYGHPGIGKTVLLGTGGPRILIMDSDSSGTLAAKVAGSNAHVAPVKDYEQLSEIYEYVANDKHEFEMVWWDSLTLFQDRALVDDILQDAAAQNPRQSADVASQREYLVSQNRIGTYVRLFCDLPIHFGWTAHVMVGEDTEGDGGMIYKPAISGKKGTYTSYICGYMNVVAYYGLTPKGNRRLITERVGEFYAKDRFHALRTNGKGYLDNPTLPQILSLVNEKMNNGATGLTPPTPIRRRRRRTANQ